MPLAQPSVAIGLATCRRPQGLAHTLSGIARLELGRFSGAGVRVLVVDNDPGGSGVAGLDTLADAFPFPLEAQIELQRGIPFVRNRLVRMAAGCDYLAFIDDDELPDPGWLAALLEAAETSGAEAILGPVHPHFEAPPPAWLLPLFAGPDLPDGAPVPEGVFRTGNLLLAVDALAGIDGPFDGRFAMTGGSDYQLGLALRARGARFVWAAAAGVTETVPESRTRLRWYLQRRYRTGITFAKAQRATRGPLTGTLRGVYRGAGSLAVGLRDLATAAGQGPNRGTVAARAAGLVCYGSGNLVGSLGGEYHEYRTIHGK